MLNVLRSSLQESPYLKWVLIAVGVGLIAYLGSYFGGGGTTSGRTDWVARVNGGDITERRLREVARNLDRYYSELFGARYDQIKPQLQVRMRFAPEVALTALDDRACWEALEEQPDGAVVVRFGAPNLEAAVRFVLSYGYQVVVLEPEELRCMVSERARAIAAHYAPAA